MQRARRMFPVAALSAIALTGCLGSGNENGSDGETARPEAARGAPNIVFVEIDDATKSQYTRQTMPFTHDYMAKNATTFDDFLVTSPLCCPARASIISGQYGHNNGVLSNSYGSLVDTGNVLPVWLQQAGYRTAHVGKFLNNYENTLEDDADVTPGWDEWFTQLEPQRYLDYEISDNGERVEFGSEDDDYLTRVLSAHALELIDEFAGGDEPFYLELDHYAPHFGGGQSGRCKGAALPDPIDEGRFENVELPRSPGIGERDLSDKPSFIQSMPEPTAFREKKATTRWQCAIESLRAVDRSIEEIVERLESQGLLDDTVLLFSSDNGVFFGEHGIPDEKHFPYREAYEVPFQIVLPERLRPESGRVDAPAASIDIAPTLLELAEGEPCDADGNCATLDGLSLLPAIRGGELPDDRARGIELSLSNNKEPYDRVCEYYGIRQGRWSYVKHVTAAETGGECEPSGEVEIYDLDEDPFQLENLAGTIPGTEERLAREAERIRECSGTAADDAERPCD